MINNLLSSIVNFFGSYLNDIASIIILLSAVYFFFRYDVFLLGGITKGCRNTSEYLNTLVGRGIECVNLINGMFMGESHPVLKRIWNDYYNDFLAIAQKEKSINTGDYFTMNSVLSIPSARKKAEAIPAVLITIGVLGTFLGFSAELTKAGTAAQGAVNDLTGAITASLSTFVVAVVVSIIFQILDRQFYQRAVTEVQIMRSVMERKVMNISAAGYLGKIMKEQEAQTVSLQKLVEENTAQFSKLISSDLLPAVSKSFEDSIRKIIAPSIANMSDVVNRLSDITVKNQTDVIQKIVDNFMDNLNESMKGQFEALGNSIQTSAESMSNAKENIDLLLTELIKNTSDQKHINETTETVVKAVAQYHQQIANSTESLGGVLGKINSFTDALTAVSNSTMEMMSRLNEQHDKLQEENNSYFEKIDAQIVQLQDGMGSRMEGILSQFAQVTEATLGGLVSTMDRINDQLLRLQEENNIYMEKVDAHAVKLQDDMGSRIEDILSQFTQSTEVTFERMDNTMNHSLDQMMSNSRELLDHMDVQIRDIGVYVKELADELNHLNVKLEDSVKEFNQQVHEGVGKTLGNFDQGLGEICMRLSGTITSIKDSIDDLPMIFSMLKNNAASTRENDI